MKATLYTVLCVAIRLGAVLMAVELLTELPLFFFNTQNYFLNVMACVLTAVGFAVAIVLWLKPGVLARWASNQQKGEVLEIAIDAHQIQYIALSVLGAWLAISGLAAAVPQGITLLLMHNRVAAYAGGGMPDDAWQAPLRDAVMFVAGVTLMIGSRGLVGLLHRLRNYPAVTDTSPRDDAAMASDD